MGYAALGVNPPLKFFVAFACLLPLVVLLVFVSSQDDFGSSQLPWNLESLFSAFTASSSSSGSGSGSGSGSSCLSRRSLMKMNPPTQELSSLWQRYLKMHTTCSAGERNWTDLLLADNATTMASDSGCSYLIFAEQSVGLGNRILSMVSAFVYALLTDRVLMLDSRQNLGSILCEPFNGSWLLPESFPYSVFDTAPALGEAIDRKFEALKVVHLKLFHIQSGGDKSFFCSEHQESLSKVKYLIWSSNQYYVTSLFQIPMFWKKLVPLFASDGELDVFAQFARLVVAPADNVWRVISAFYASYLSCSSTMVGLQIRPHGRPDIKAFDTTVNQAIQKCLWDNALLPRISSAAAKLIKLQKRSTVSVFVASLQGKYFESLRDVYLAGAGTEDGRTVAVHSLSHEGHEEHSLHQDQLALAEMWLLSLADSLVTSGYSTFGYIAHGISGRKPFYLKYENGTCFSSRSSQPCTHAPQQPSCSSARNSRNPEHEAWIQRHVQHCQDHTPGLQLVN